jgi:hypothetical protein
MGQYRQWLHFREVDQRLRTQLGLLSQELTELQTQVARFEKHASSYEDNIILRALTTYFAAKASPATLKQQDTAPELAAQTAITEQMPELETVSPALFGWSYLPNLGLQDIHDQEPQHSAPLPLPPPLPAPRPNVDLLPDDMAAFLHEHGETAPQLSLPWWLRNVLASSPDTQGHGLVDHQSLRTDYLVQRWLERWHTSEEPVEQNVSREEPQP